MVGVWWFVTSALPLFRICTVLAGGTGAGLIVDVISQIRTNHPSTQALGEAEPTFKIRLFVVGTYHPSTKALQSIKQLPYHKWAKIFGCF